jgi:hypothetical protein
MTNLTPDYTHQGTEGTIPSPKDDLLADLPQIDFEGDEDGNWDETVKTKVLSIEKEIDEIDSVVIDIIGAQMESVSNLFQETITSTQSLFTALVQLKNQQSEQVTSKLGTATNFLRKLQNAIEHIRKL